MTLDAAFLALMPETISVYSRSGTDNYGMTEYVATATTYRCRRESGKRRQVGPDGREIVPTWVLYVDPAGTPITTDDRVVLDGETYEVLSVDNLDDDTGLHHQVVSLA